MTFNSQYILNNISHFDIPYIIIVDGSHTRIDGCGDIDIQYFKLKYVLHVSIISNNLSFIRNFIEDNNHATIFFIIVVLFRIF